MITPEIPFSHWQPLSVPELTHLFAGAPFLLGLAGGYAVEQFVGRCVRDHGDIDVIVYRDQQLDVQRWLSDWHLYAADPPRSLRPWVESEYLPYGIHDIWGHTGIQAWQLQIMLTESEGDRWFSKRSRLIGGQRGDLIVAYGSVPCIRIEVQLLYKARNPRSKDDLDFEACLPLMSTEAKRWLATGLEVLYPRRSSLAKASVEIVIYVVRRDRDVKPAIMPVPGIHPFSPSRNCCAVRARLERLVQ